MKKWMLCCFLGAMLTGCGGGPDAMDTGLALRGAVLRAEQLQFSLNVTAEYTDQIQTFSMDCRADREGNVTFTVTEPEAISGIGGKLSGEGGTLVFDDTALHFPLMGDGRLSPVSAPWIFLKTLRSGYITAAGREEEEIRLSVNDTYEADALRLDIWLDGEDLPVRADILYEGRRILEIHVTDFEIL